MISIKEFMDCYNAAIEGKQICRKTITRGYIEDSYEYEDVNFLNMNMSDILKEDTDDVRYEYIISPI